MTFSTDSFSPLHALSQRELLGSAQALQAQELIFSLLLERDSLGMRKLPFFADALAKLLHALQPKLKPLQ